MLTDKQEKKLLIATPEEKLSVNLEISGSILFRNVPIKNALIEFIVHGVNGETLLNLGKTFTASNGHFYFSQKIPLSFRGQDVGVRVCVYSTPSVHGKPFPIFFGSESFLLSPCRNVYDLGGIYLQLAWSFCERPLFFVGKVLKKNHDESVLTGKIVQIRTPNGHVLAEAAISIDGSYHIYTYADGRVPEYTKILLCVVDKGRTLSELENFINPLDYIYETNIEIDDPELTINA